ncbi:MAG: SbcC/MukB-like Walker B domain-containing protein [Verrucomicrobiales bacterium]
MSQRISLTRVVALNWYGFRQVFDLDDNVLISGAFGTGKSAILDLIQYVLLGKNWRANRAAAGNARGRDLTGYCLGDTNQTRNGARHFLRQNGVTLVALEFSWPADKARKEPRRETWGIRLEFTSPDAESKDTYFYIPARLNYADAAPDGKLLSDDAFRTWIRREFGNDCLFSRQRDYLEEMSTARHLNYDPAAFHRTFPKAIAFEVEEDVEKFIREFILEESPLDVAEVRTALRAYDDTRKRLEKQEHEAGLLRRIEEQHQLYQTSRREEAILQHVGDAMRHLQAEEKRDQSAAKLERLKQEHETDLQALNEAQGEFEQVKKLLDQTRFEVSKDPDSIKIAELNQQRVELQNRASMLREAQRSINQQLDDRHYRWVQWLKYRIAMEMAGFKEILGGDDHLLSQLRTGSDAERLEALPKLANRFNEIWRKADQLAQPLHQELSAAEKRLRQLAEDLEKVSKGQSPGAFPLLEAARQKLGDRIQQLGRLIEVKPEAERWWPALELYLGRNRWVLVPNRQDSYREALEILKRVAPGREPESLLNPAETKSLGGKSRPGSLFEKVDIKDPLARAYVEHLLGDILCVETVEELEKCDASRAITPEGIFKQSPLRRRLKPAASVDLTLGTEGLERIRKTKLKESEDTRQHYAFLKQRLGDLNGWLDNGRKAGLADASLPDRSAEIPLLPQIEKDLSRVRETIDLLNTPELAERQKRLAALEEQYRIVTEKVGGLRNRMETYSLSIRPAEEQLAHAIEDLQQAELAMQESRVKLSLHFQSALEGEITKRLKGFREDYPKWTDCFSAVIAKSKEAGVLAVDARGTRNRERFAMANDRDERGDLRHPEYQHDFSTEDENNDAWSARLRVLETVELQKSRQLAADRKRDWERRLEDNVLNELNRRITEAQNTVRLLDRYLSQPIGKFRYRISQRRDTAGYAALWRLLDSGLEATDPLAAAIQEGEVQRAKDELMKAVDAPDGSDERARRLLDYRNYHRYDIEMVPADKPDAPPISLGRSGRNLSGGENQAPFFISMLAAFRRVYDRGDRASARSQQLGLVVMDEAFSKLSGDGIEDCLSLARTFQLQLVMAFPPERLGVMVPHAQTVIMCQKHVARDSQGYVSRIDNIPLITTMAEAMEALQ